MVLEPGKSWRRCALRVTLMLRDLDSIMQLATRTRNCGQEVSTIRDCVYDSFRAEVGVQGKPRH